MGYKHGKYQVFDKDVPLANLFVTMQKRMGLKADSFADSSGNLDSFLL